MNRLSSRAARLAAALALATVASGAFALPIVYVSPAPTGSDANAGDTPGAPVLTLAQAVTLADATGAEIRLLPGEHLFVDTDITKEGLTLRGADAAGNPTTDASLVTIRPANFLALGANATVENATNGLIRWTVGGGTIRDLTVSGENAAVGNPLPERANLVRVQRVAANHSAGFTANNVVFRDTRANLLLLQNSRKDNTVTNCSFLRAGDITGLTTFNGRGLGLADNGNTQAVGAVTVTGCTFEDLDRGINESYINFVGKGTATVEATDSGSVNVSNTSFARIGYGILAFGQSTDFDIDNCDFDSLNGWAWGCNGNNVNNTRSTMVVNFTNSTITNTYAALLFNAFQSGSRFNFSNNTIIGSGTVQAFYVYAGSKEGGAIIRLENNTYDGVFNGDFFPTSPTNYMTQFMDWDSYLANYNAVQDSPLDPGAIEVSRLEVVGNTFLGSPTDPDFRGTPVRQLSTDPSFPTAAGTAGVTSNTYYTNNTFDGLNSAIETRQNRTLPSSPPYNINPIGVYLGAADNAAQDYDGNTVRNCGTGVLADGFFTTLNIAGNVYGGFIDCGTAIDAGEGTTANINSTSFRGNATDLAVDSNAAMNVGGALGTGNLFWDSSAANRLRADSFGGPAPVVGHNFYGDYFANENATGVGGSAATFSSGTGFGTISDATPVAQLDRDADGRFDAQELFVSFAQASTFNTPAGSLTADADGDGFVDWIEQAYGTLTTDATDTPSLGDVTNDGNVDLGDAVRALQVINGTVAPLTGNNPNAINVTGSTPFTSLSNPLQILRFQNGSRTAFPAVPGIN